MSAKSAQAIRWALGLDFGTSSVRALVVDTDDGRELGTGVCGYASGEQGVITDGTDPLLARQHPGDYLASAARAVRDALCGTRSVGSEPPAIIGIGVDTTGSTPIPVDEHGTPLAMLPEFHGEPAALAWLWKDHSAYAEAAEITDRARGEGRPYLNKCGGTYSSEWYWSKVLRCERTAPRVAKAAHAWVESCDWIPARLTGRTTPAQIRRSICGAGHKAMYHTEWGGLPHAEFLDALSPGLSRYRESFASPAVSSIERSGTLCEEVARAFGVSPGIPVAVGAFDAHMGAVGAGIAPGTLVKILGTSTCDCMVAPLDRALPDIPGVCGVVPESILPGMYGIEAGQSAVGDLFDWFVTRIVQAHAGTGIAEDAHSRLSDGAARLRPGESGLVALDWNNGNRTVLVDPLLSGALIGQTLATTQAEIYRALIEATAFGALKIIERIREGGVEIKDVVNCGGIAEKSPLVMQIYADVCDMTMKVSRSAQTCALGAAIFGSVVGGAHESVPAAQRAMCGVKRVEYRPIAGHASVYRRLFSVYTRLHDAFGTRGEGSLFPVMKELFEIRRSARGSGGTA